MSFSEKNITLTMDRNRSNLLLFKCTALITNAWRERSLPLLSDASGGNPGLFCKFERKNYRFFNELWWRLITA